MKRSPRSRRPHGSRGPEGADEGAAEPGVAGQADPGEGGREAGTGGGDTYVRAQGESQPGADAGALNGRDDGLLERVEGFDDRVVLAAHGGERGGGADGQGVCVLLEVLADAEGGATRGEEDRPYRRSVGVDATHGGQEPVLHGEVECVVGRGAAQFDHGDGSVEPVADPVRARVGSVVRFACGAHCHV